MQSKFIFLILVSTIVTSCQYPIHSGTLVNDQQIIEMESKEFTKAEIEEKLGTPNIIPDYSPNTWYYIHRSMTRRAFFKPVVHGQKVVKITFNGEVLNSIKALDNEHDSNIMIIQEYIRTKGTELNPMQEYIRNFGRFNKSKKKDSRR